MSYHGWMRKKTPLKNRFTVLARDGFKCTYCGASAQDGASLTVDHVTPVANGGTDDVDNLRTACWTCNAGKGSLDVSTGRRHGSKYSVSDETIREAFERVKSMELLPGEACKAYGFSISVFYNRRMGMGLDYPPEVVSHHRRQAAMKNLEGHMEKVKAFVEEGLHIDDALEKVGINMGQFKWARRKVGEKWKRGVRPWLAAARLSAVSRVLAGEQIATVARDVGVKRSTVYCWVKKHQEGNHTQETAS